MYRSSWWLAAAWIGTNVALVQQVVVAKSVTEIGRTAQAITVEIRQVGSDGVGSGILLQRQGDVYTVLTAGHVIKSGSAFALKTIDGKVHQSIANSIKSANNNIDLAVLKFRSSNNYSLAKIGASRSLELGAPIYVGGFPAPTYAVGGGVFNFTEGRIIANASLINPLGYSLIYSNPTLSGMSGGPVLNEAGELVAIHGLGDRAGKKGELEKLGRNLGIVVENFGSEAVAMGVQLDQQINAAPPNPNLTASDYFLRASTKYDQNDYEGAIADYTEAIRIDPRNADAYNGRGLAKAKNYIKAINSYDLVAAIADYNKAININPNIAAFYSNRAAAYQQQNKYKEALIDYSKAIAISPRNSDLYLDRGYVYAQIGDRSNSIKDYRSGEVIMNPSTSSEYDKRGRIRFELKRYQDSIDDYTKAIKLNPGNSWLYVHRADVYLGFKKDALAIADYTQIINLKLIMTELAYLLRGNVYYRLDDYPKAIADYNQSAPDACGSSNQMEACFTRGIIKLELGDNKAAISDFDMLEQSINGYENVYYYRGLANQNLGNLEKAQKDYRKALNTAGRDGSYKAYCHLGLAHFGLGQEPVAIANFTEAIKLEPNNPEAYHHRGVAYQALKDRNNAIKDLQMADRLYLKENRLNKHRIVTQLLSKM
jgi:tetratricopeptide (TPR) repeat protein